MKKVYGVGVGPGDKELITLKAYRLIKECNYIFAPKSRGASTAKSIALEYAEGKEIIEIEFPMGEDNTERYKAAAENMDSILKEGESAVFLTIGDPMTYSTYIYLMHELQKLNIDTETVPGITSYNAASALTNMAVGLKGDNFYLCDGDLDEDILKKVQSVCILKVNKNKEDILSKLERNNFKYAYIKRCTQNNEKVLYDKDEILKDDEYMALILARRF